MIKNLNDIPDDWWNLLSWVQVDHPKAVLAGGCLRDLVLGGEVKDLDIFLPFGSRFATPEGWTEVDTVVLSDAGDTPIISTTVYTVEDLPLPVNIIIAATDTDIAGLISRFDFGACQIAHDGLNCYLTMDAVMDLLNRRITMVAHFDDERFARSMERAVRFRAKYAGTDVVVDTTEAEFEHTSLEPDPFA